MWYLGRLTSLMNPCKVRGFDEMIVVFSSGVTPPFRGTTLGRPAAYACLRVFDLVKQCLFFTRYKGSTSYYCV